MQSQSGSGGVAPGPNWMRSSEGRFRPELGFEKLAQDVLQFHDQIDVEAEGYEQEHQANDGEGADAAPDGAKILDQLLLLEGIAVGGFADAVKLVFDALQARDLLHYLGAQLAVTIADLGQATLHGLHVHMDNLGLGRWGGMHVGSNERADSGGEVAVNQWQQLLHQRNGGANGVDSPLEAGLGRVRCSCCGRSA